MVHLAKVEVSIDVRFPQKKKKKQLTGKQNDDFELIMFEKPTTWRLTTKSENNAKAIFCIQGILCAYDLPPIRSG